MPRNPTWVRDELILALDLYFRVNPLHTSEQNPEILALSKVLNALPIHAERPERDVFRNPNGVYMKLCNFLRFDPSYKGKGLTRGGKEEEAVWNEFGQDIDRLNRTSDAIRAGATSITAQEVFTEVSSQDEEFAEGRILTALHKRRERSPTLVRKKKAEVFRREGTLACEVCDFDFQARYGMLGTGFVECHHKAPLSSLKERVQTRLIDIAIVCANCHRMLHRSRPMFSIDDLKALLQ